MNFYALITSMSGKEMPFQVSHKAFRLDDGRSRNDSDSKIQTVGTATEKAGVPYVLRLIRGILSSRSLAERICWRPETSETGTLHLGDRYTEDTDEQ